MPCEKIFVFWCRLLREGCCHELGKILNMADVRLLVMMKEHSVQQWSFLKHLEKLNKFLNSVSLKVTGYQWGCRKTRIQREERFFSSGRSFADICDGVEGKWSIGRNRGILTGRPCETKKAAETIWVISWLWTEVQKWRLEFEAANAIGFRDVKNLKRTKPCKVNLTHVCFPLSHSPNIQWVV